MKSEIIMLSEMNHIQKESGERKDMKVGGRLGRRDQREDRGGTREGDGGYDESTLHTCM
jgi:hypothetical protein